MIEAATVPAKKICGRILEPLTSGTCSAIGLPGALKRFRPSDKSADHPPESHRQRERAPYPDLQYASDRRLGPVPFRCGFATSDSGPLEGSPKVCDRRLGAPNGRANSSRPF